MPSEQKEVSDSVDVEQQPRIEEEGSKTQEQSDDKLPWLVRQWLKVVDCLSSNFLGGPKWLKLAHVVNFQKSASLLVCLGMMRHSGNTTPTAAAYTALHGGYGLCWLLKEMVFPDPKWQPRITFGAAFASFASVLAPYWFIAYNAIEGRSQRSNLALCGAGVVYGLGLCLMIGSDAQKYFVLRLRRGLITDGFFARVRHPNYLGEMMIYGSFAFVSGAWSSWLVLAWVWPGLFLPYMLRKEASMSRYPEWKDYKQRSGFLLPALFPRK